jgi:hypothetical protein
MFITWVLGSGFSRALGGPLLSDLFTDAAKWKREICFPQDKFPILHDKFSQAALRLYKYGLGNERGSVAAWSNPEDFLDQLDDAADLGASSTQWKNLLKLLEASHTAATVHDISKISESARRIMAAECSAFLVDNEPQQEGMMRERWFPYLRWARDLAHSDVVITFNYDLVLDLLNQQTKNLAFRLPLTKDEVSDFDQRRQREEKTLVLKLHGSVNWGKKRIDAESQYRIDEDKFYALTGPADETVIGSPGPSKRRTMTHLSQLWEQAQWHLQHCDAIVFIGYSFPLTDAIARQWILDAVSENEGKKLKAYTVLGQDSPDTNRVEQMLRLSMGVDPSSAVHSYSLYAQDFLGIYNRERFEREWRGHEQINVSNL